jgi:hypothetical protein
MKAVFRRACVLILSAALAGCAAGSGRYGADVTRFHLGGPIARGQIAVEPFQPVHANSVEFRNHAAAIERQLARLGWTVVRTVGQSEQVALVDISQGRREALVQRSPVSVGVGGGTGGWGSGVGVGLGFNLGGRPRDLIATLLEVRIKRRSDGTVFWEGRASTEAKVGSPEAQPAAAVERLAEALFRDFPGESGQTIRVE